MRASWVTTLLAVGCAHAPPPPPRPPPLTGWRTLRTAHVRLRTDLPSADARTTIERLEVLRAALQTAWSLPEETPGTTEAIVLRDGAELRTFTEWSGVATVTARGPLLVTAGSPVHFGDVSPDLALLAHEMAHDLDHRRMPGAPRWFDEGLAAYLESAELIDTGRVRLGAIRREELEQARTHRLIPLDTLVQTQWETLDPAALLDLYRSARLWVQLLRAEERDRMRALEAAVARGVPWRVAWPKVRQGLDLARLEEALRRWLAAGAFPTELHRFTAPPTTIEEQPLAPWRVHIAQAELWSAGISPADPGDRVQQVRGELEAAARAAPDEPLPRVLLADAGDRSGSAAGAGGAAAAGVPEEPGGRGLPRPGAPRAGWAARGSPGGDARCGAARARRRGRPHRPRARGGAGRRLHPGVRQPAPCRDASRPGAPPCSSPGPASSPRWARARRRSTRRSGRWTCWPMPRPRTEVAALVQERARLQASCRPSGPPLRR